MYPLFNQEVTKKADQLYGVFVFVVIGIRVYTLYNMIVNFCENQIWWVSLSFLSMIIYGVLYTRCLRYNICSAWFLDIRALTCFGVYVVVLAITFPHKEIVYKPDFVPLSNKG